MPARLILAVSEILENPQLRDDIKAALRAVQESEDEVLPAGATLSDIWDNPEIEEFIKAGLREVYGSPARDGTTSNGHVPEDSAPVEPVEAESEQLQELFNPHPVRDPGYGRFAGRHLARIATGDQAGRAAVRPRPVTAAPRTVASGPAPIRTYCRTTPRCRR